MTTLPDGLQELADHFGIAREFYDWKGQHTLIPEETLVHVLAALGVDASTQEAREAARADIHNSYWRRVVPECTVVQEGQTVRVPIHVPAGTGVSVHVELEGGGDREVWQIDNEVPDIEVDGAMRGEATFLVPGDLPLGYHSLRVSGAEGETTASLYVTPKFVGFPRSMLDRTVWGYATQLYSVTSDGSWGVGDLTDLSDMAMWSGAQQSADYVLVNPLHAAEAVAPMEPSPYLPTSRRFMNPIYIRPESIPEYALLKGKKRKRIKAARRALLEALDPDTIERDPSWAAKLEALRLVFKAGRRPARQIAFDEFRAREGEDLHRFAVWSALSEEFGPKWPDWPEEFRHPESEAVLDFARSHPERVEFHEWIQWIAQTQLSAAQKAAEEAGMSVGIINDLAVGVSPWSAETWMLPDLFAADIHVGAPPDQYNQTGQDWGQPPWRPDRLAQSGYEPFRAMVRAALGNVGGIRIDHILGLFRLWWVPAGLGPRYGTYVRNDHEALVGILALEAHRAQALVIGEDLGTVEPGLRDYMAGRGILGTSVLWFEFDWEGRPLAAEHWREYCMASVTTHDLPPTLGYLAGDHVRLRERLGLLTEPLEVELEEAQKEQAAWLGRLLEVGVLRAEDRDDPEEVMLALHRYLRLTPSRVRQAALVDAVGERRTQNQPGTHNEYPNWRIPLGDATGKRISLEEIFTADLPKRVAEVMNGTEQR